MGIYLNPGNGGFKRAINSKIYVDKTGMLKYINDLLDTEQGYLCVSRPRRFGKSVTAEMLVAYYGKMCNSESLFSELDISRNTEYREHLNQYDVIHVDITTFLSGVACAMDAVELFHSEVIRELKEEFPDAVDETATRLPNVLANINVVYGTKFIIVIDEWDAIFREAAEDTDAQKSYIDLLRGLFKSATSKRFIKLAYMTGILPIKKYGKQSALNNFDEYTMTNTEPLEQYVGFTENEVRQLCDKYGADFEETKRWYDGYVLGNCVHIYNPKSVVDSLCRRRIANYWTGTETYESLKEYISMNFDGLKDCIVTMLSGVSCNVNTNKFQNDMTSFESKDDVLTLLIHLGYLAYDYMRNETYIPNEELKVEFKNAVESTNWNEVIHAIQFSDQLLKATWAGDADVVAAMIQKVHMENTSLLKYNDENALSCVIALAYYNAINEYTLIREMPSGEGIADIVFLPRKKSEKPAMVVELKYNQSAQGAIRQIKEKKYINALKDYKGNILLVGVSYDKKNKEHECVIEKYMNE